MKAIILARVSDKKQDSNEAQVTRVSEYVRAKGLISWKTYEIEESSTKGDRRRFQEVIKDIEQSLETIALVVDTVDRLQRSWRESVLLDDLRKQGKLEIHFYRENLIINQNSNSADLLRWDMGVMFARSYVLQLSDNIKRKQEQMRKNGEWASRPPIGYISLHNDEGRRTRIIPDAQRAPFIQKIFELYGRGTYSVKRLKAEVDDLGFRSETGKPLSISNYHRVINNPFYYGVMKCKQGLFPHNYEPLISKHLFLRCQEVLASYEKKPHQSVAKPFIFRGLITCSTCGCMISPEIKKGRYTYYSCTNFKGTCKRRYVPEKVLLKPVYEALRSIQMTSDRIEELTRELKRIGQNEARFFQNSMTSLRDAYDLYEKRINTMYDDKLDGRITQETYDKKLKEYKGKQADLLTQMEEHSEADGEFYLTANTVFNLAKRAVEVFESSEIPEKRQFLTFLLQNLTLDGQNLRFSLKEPFNTIAATRHQPIGFRDRDSNPSFQVQSLASCR